MMKKLSMLLIAALLLVVCSASLASFRATPYPNGAVSITFDDGRKSQISYAWPLMKERGMTGTFYIPTDKVGSNGYLTINDLHTLERGGNEIGSHSKTHAGGFTGLSKTRIQDECRLSRQALESWGFTVNNFAYPYGSCNDWTDSIIDDYYRSARDAYTGPYIMDLPTTEFRLPSYSGETESLSYIINQITSTKGYATVFFHNVVPTPPDKLSISTAAFASFLDTLKTKGIKTLTVNEALDVGIKPSPTTPPTSYSVTITLQPFNMVVHLTCKSWTAPEKIVVQDREWTFKSWNDGKTSLSRTFTADGTFKIMYD